MYCKYIHPSVSMLENAGEKIRERKETKTIDRYVSEKAKSGAGKMLSCKKKLRMLRKTAWIFIRRVFWGTFLSL